MAELERSVALPERQFNKTDHPAASLDGGESAGPFNVCLLPPAFMPDSFWEGVAQGIRDKGHNAFTPVTPRSDPRQSIEAEVRATEEVMGNLKAQYLVALSGAIEVAVRYIDPRRGNFANVMGMMVIGSGGPKGKDYDPISPATGQPMTNRHTDEFTEGVSTKDGCEVMDPEVAEKVLAHDIKDEALRKKICRNLVKRRVMTDGETKDLYIVTNDILPIAWVYGRSDKAHVLDREREVAKQIFRVEAEPKDFGHLPPITHRKETVDMILENAHAANAIQLKRRSQSA